MVGFSGLSGCYSCMNDAGVATTRMMTNHGTPGSQMDFSQPFTPLNIVMREALEASDVDGDGASTADDLATALDDSVRSSAYNIMIVGPASAGREPAVVEINNRQFALRTGSDSPELPPTVLAATNHMRKLYPAVPDSRYAAMRGDVLGWNGEINLSRMWEVLQSMYDEWMTGATTQSMIFVPFNRRLAVSYTDEEALAPFKEPTWLEWDDIFGLGNDDDADDDSGNAGDDDSGWFSDDDDLSSPTDDDELGATTTDDDAGSDGACGC